VSKGAGGTGRLVGNAAGFHQAYRTYSLLAAFVLLRAFGNLSLAWGTKHFPETLALNPLSYLKAMLSPVVFAGVGMLILAMLVRMAVLGVADLSFVLPLTAIGYVFAAMLGRFFLHEDVSPQRWLGTALIFIGVAVVGSTPQNTTRNTTRSESVKESS
jgi:drug/metabolite transporter (DMT)-like permease